MYGRSVQCQTADLLTVSLEMSVVFRNWRTEMAGPNTPPGLDVALLEGTLRRHRKPAASGLYLAALLVFVLPFVSVSCGSQTVLTLSGLDLTFGRELGSQYGTSAGLGITSGRLDPHLWLLLALAAPIVGLVATWHESVTDRATGVVLLVAGAFGLLMMLTLLGSIASANSTIQSGCQSQPDCVSLASAVQIGPSGGPWLEALVDAGILALGILWLRRWAPAVAPSTRVPASPEPPPPTRPAGSGSS